MGEEGEAAGAEVLEVNHLELDDLAVGRRPYRLGHPVPQAFSPSRLHGKRLLGVAQSMLLSDTESHKQASSKRR
jgi:hypothetical protein